MTNSSGSEVRFPDVSKLLAPRLKDDKRSLGKLAKDLGLSPSALSSYSVGRRAPKEDVRKKLAKALISDPTQRANFLSELAKAVENKTSSGAGRVEAIISGQTALRVGVIPYGWLSKVGAFGTAEGFLDKLMQRFLLFSGLRPKKFEEKAVDNAIAELARGDLDIVLGMLATPARAFSMRLYRTPVRIGIGAVIATAEKEGDARNGLSIRSAKSERTKLIYPIVFQDEIGHIYVKHSLEMEKERGQMEVIERPAFEVLRDILMLPDDQGRTRVVVCDEYTAIQFWLFAKGELHLVYSPEAERALGEQMPAYPLSIAGSRADETLWRYFTESFELYLESDFEGVQSIYEELYDNLNREIGNSNTPTKWAGRALGLDKTFSTTDRLWGQIVEKAAKTKGFM